MNPREGGVAALGEGGAEVSDEAPTSRLFSRRRRSNVKGGRQRKHEVWVSAEEEGVLSRLAAAQHVTIPRLLIESAVSSEAGETPTERRAAMAELFTLHRLLAAISNNVNQQTRAANATGRIEAEMRATLAKVRETAEHIDAAIDRLSLS